MGFQVLKSLVGSGVGPRLGSFRLPQRLPMQTPSFVGVTSRGTLPHLTPDIIMKHTSFESAYMALEDCKHRNRDPLP